MTNELYPSPDLFVMRPEEIIGLITAEVVLGAFGLGCGLASEIAYNSIFALDGRVVDVTTNLDSIGQLPGWLSLACFFDIFLEFHQSKLLSQHYTTTTATILMAILLPTRRIELRVFRSECSFVCGRVRLVSVITSLNFCAGARYLN